MRAKSRLRTSTVSLIARVGTDRHNPAKKFYQMVYYDSGVGTGDLTKLEQLREGGTGAGLAENVIEACTYPPCKRISDSY
jgi:uncharacterized protein (DUF2235 family)